MPYEPEKRKEYLSAYRITHGVSIRSVNRKYRQSHKPAISKTHGNWHKIENAKTQGRLRKNKKWTEQEIELLWDTSNTSQELAFILQRTFTSIRAARERFAMRRPKTYIHNGTKKKDMNFE